MTIFAGQDLNQYAKWKKLVAPGGQVYYEIPGSGYIYDPTLSAASGKSVIYTNPTAKLKEREKLEKQAKDAASPLNQALPLVGGIAGTLGAAHAMNAFGPTTAADKLLAAQTEAQILKNTAAQAALNGSGITASTPAIPGLAGGAPLAGGELVVNGAPVADAATAALPESSWGLGGGTAATVGGGLMAAKGLYDTVGGFQNGGAGMRSGLTTTGAGIGTMVLPGIGTVAGAALGNALGYGLQGNGWKNDLVLGAVAPPLLLAKKLGVPMSHMTTLQREQNRWEDSTASDAVKNKMIGADYFAGTGGEQSRDESLLTPDAIRYNSDNYRAAPDWEKWTKGEQDQFLSTLLSEGKVSERKGGIYLDDDRAKELAQQIRGNTQTTQPFGKPGEAISTLPLTIPPGTNIQELGKQLAEKKNSRNRR